MKISKIYTGNVEYRAPYYIKCAYCQYIKADNTLEDVVEIANKEGWGYIYQIDMIMCPYCIEEKKEELEPIEKEESHE